MVHANPLDVKGEKCWKCEGLGYERKALPCSRCGGEGVVRNDPFSVKAKCYKCDGSGVENRPR
jgi:DnaJ-class molecular chaperone